MATVLGITGGIASGKSTVMAMFGELGASMLSADDVAREVLVQGSHAFDEVVRRFGQEVVGSDGNVDRKALGDAVFGDPEALRALNAITHPRIIEILNDRIEQFRTSAAKADVLAVEIPLLIECGLESVVDKVVVVAAEQVAQINRLTTRGLSLEQARQRIAAQMPVCEKVPFADWVIHTDVSLEDTKRQVEGIWAEVIF